MATTYLLVGHGVPATRMAEVWKQLTEDGQDVEIVFVQPAQLTLGADGEVLYETRFQDGNIWFGSKLIPPANVIGFVLTEEVWRNALLLVATLDGEPLFPNITARWVIRPGGELEQIK